VVVFIFLLPEEIHFFKDLGFFGSVLGDDQLIILVFIGRDYWLLREFNRLVLR
jgi:hypothetical protein